MPAWLTGSQGFSWWGDGGKERFRSYNSFTWSGLAPQYGLGHIKVNTGCFLYVVILQNKKQPVHLGKPHRQKSALIGDIVRKGRYFLTLMDTPKVL